MDIPKFEFDFQNPDGSIAVEFKQLKNEAMIFMHQLLKEKRASLDKLGIEWLYKAFMNGAVNTYLALEYAMLREPEHMDDIVALIFQHGVLHSFAMSYILTERAKLLKQKKAKEEIENLNKLMGA